MPIHQDFIKITDKLENILVKQELEELLQSNKTLKIKAGFDPTAADLHLGHTILLNKLRQFQDLGHQVYFIIGDYTAAIGDPSGRNNLRPPLSPEEIEHNAKTYTQEVFKILIPEKTKILYNSEWLNKLSGQDLIQLASRSTLARMIERDDFSKRYNNNTPIYLHEFLYPLLQGYDSVAIQADIEIGGTDQTFNLLMGRELQKHYQQKPQVVISMPILEGLDGVKKMSKSLDNYIGLKDSPTDMFGKVMSINDSLMWRYYLLLTAYTEKQVQQIQQEQQSGSALRDLKLQLANIIVSRYHNSEIANSEQKNFLSRFQQNQIPDDIKNIHITSTIDTMPIANLLKEAGFSSSTSDAIRLIKQGALYIDGTKVLDHKLQIPKGQSGTYKLGKKNIAKIHLN